MPFDWKTVDWDNGRVRMIDQTRLPETVEWLALETVEEVARAIEIMQVRGAPAIGATAALGMALCASQSKASDSRSLLEDLSRARDRLARTRPTAVNLFWALERMQAAAQKLAGRFVPEIRQGLLNEALAVLDEDVQANRRMGRSGGALIPDGATVLTHCNAGALATVGYGTALGVIRGAAEAGKRIRVLADETRPRLQGMKLTAWELHQDGIQVTIISDNMSGSLMRQGKIDCAVVGADRIAANGDTANKIGTYTVAVLCREHGIPFYVAAPLSTIDWSLESGDQIPIEERDSREVTHIGDTRIAPEGVPALNPSFDVTPAALVTALITERGVVHRPDRDALKVLLER
ncbi:MAG: S-methyl-5-thioribose-1-phosphate isomerase [Armatimonadetes bacterium]|nr:S-methyl-5-thioribose-1-phosphate isomerase [Armatimonadota bacterium]